MVDFVSVLNQALELPLADRVDLAQRLIESVDHAAQPHPPTVDLGELVAKRERLVDSGTFVAYDLDAARERLSTLRSQLRVRS